MAQANCKESFEEDKAVGKPFEKNIVALEQCYVASIKAAQLFDIMSGHKEIRKEHNFKINFLKKIGLLSMVGIDKLTNLCS